MSPARTAGTSVAPDRTGGLGSSIFSFFSRASGPSSAAPPPPCWAGPASQRGPSAPSATPAAGQAEVERKRRGGRERDMAESPRENGRVHGATRRPCYARAKEAARASAPLISVPVWSPVFLDGRRGPARRDPTE